MSKFYFKQNAVCEKVEAQMDDLRLKVAILQAKDRNKTIQITTLQSKLKALEKGIHLFC